VGSLFFVDAGRASCSVRLTAVRSDRGYGSKVTFDVDIRRASYFLDIHPSVHAGTRGAPKLALRELPRGAVVFPLGSLDSYLSDVSAEVMIYQCQAG
jgi:hypothetical protein